MPSHEVILKVRGKVSAEPGSLLTIGRLAEVAGQPGLAKKARGLIVAKAGGRHRGALVLSALDIARVVMSSLPDVQVSLLGEDEVVVLVEARKTRRPLLALVKTVLVATVLFLGSGLAIMNFHSEVSMAQAQARLYWFITGEAVTRPLIMQVPYSLGIGLGIGLFFNHFRWLMGRDEPSPLEVEMFLYDRNVQQCIASREEERAGEDTP
ncbi:MAG: stage V sporulation protein AA [Bacillota bacterium]